MWRFEQEGLNEPSPLSRRRFLARMTGALAGVGAAVLGVPSAAFVMGSARDDEGHAWISLGPTDAFAPGDPVRVTTVVTRQRGYVEEDEELTLYVSTRDGTAFEALSDKCTHLACRVRLVEEGVQGSDKPGFFCPCHNGVFDAGGNVISGPVPRPLDRLDVKVEGGQLFVREL